MTKLRVAWFSDLAPGDGVPRTVSASVSKLLLPLLRERYEIEVFHNSFEGYEDYSVHHCLTALRCHRAKPFDVFFYQLEDTPQTQWTRIHCALMPGVQLSHDYLFTSFGPEPILNSPWHSIIERLDTRELDGSDAEWPDRFDEQYQKGPHAIRESAYAAVRLFSQPGMVSEAKRLSERSVVKDQEVPSAYLPLPVREELFSITAPEARRVLFCGSPWVQDRAHKIFTALKSYDASFPLVWLLEESEVESAKSIVSEFGLSNVTLKIGRTVTAWEQLVTEGGLAVHTLFSVFGQTGPYLAQSFAVGLPCVVTRFGHSEMLPDSVVFKVQAGETEAAELKAVLEKVFDEGLRPDVELVKSYALEHHAPKLVAEELALVFEAQQSSIAETMKRWQELKEKARTALLDESRSCWPEGPELVGENELFEKVYREFGWTGQSSQ